MRAVDTDVLVRLLTRDDPRQAAAAEAYVASGAWVPHIVLVEAIWVLTSVYKLKPAALATGLGMLLSHRHLTLQEADLVAAALAQFRRKPALSFSGCLVLEIARKAGHLPLGTLDGDLSKLEGAQRL
jgi:predicted nucleic-acid-binding protein